MINIEIVGNPIPWKRPGRKLLNGKILTYDTQHKEKEFTQFQIKTQYQEPLLSMDLNVDLIFYLPIPKSTGVKMRQQMLHGYVKPIKKPDLDNLTKYILDCMNQVVFVDDAQITMLTLRKCYSLVPRTLIRIIPEENNPQKEAPEYSEDDGFDDLYI